MYVHNNTDINELCLILSHVENKNSYLYSKNFLLNIEYGLKQKICFELIDVFDLETEIFLFINRKF